MGRREKARESCDSRALCFYFRDRCRYLDRGNVLRLPAFGAFGHVELHGLAFLQALEAASLNSGEMHENVFAILTADEAVALGVVKPLHCSLFCHWCSYSCFLKCAEKIRCCRRGVTLVGGTDLQLLVSP